MNSPFVGTLRKFGDASASVQTRTAANVMLNELSRDLILRQMTSTYELARAEIESGNTQQGIEHLQSVSDRYLDAEKAYYRTPKSQNWLRSLNAVYRNSARLLSKYGTAESPTFVESHFFSDLTINGRSVPPHLFPTSLYGRRLNTSTINWLRLLATDGGISPIEANQLQQAADLVENRMQENDERMREELINLSRKKPLSSALEGVDFRSSLFEPPQTNENQ